MGVATVKRKSKVEVGMRFGRLTVTGFFGVRKNHYLWDCVCDCGNTRTVQYDNLLSGSSSCGCLRKELMRERRTIHGESRRPNETAEFRTYCWAKDRCNNPNNPKYHRYGGRGIEFRFTSYPEFLAEVGRKPTPKHSLNRIDNDGHYEKGNVEWATNTEQQANTSRTRLITINGVTHCVSEWNRIKGFGKNTILARLERNWCESCAVNLPRHSKCTHLGGGRNG